MKPCLLGRKRTGISASCGTKREPGITAVTSRPQTLWHSGTRFHEMEHIYSFERASFIYYRMTLPRFLFESEEIGGGMAAHFMSSPRVTDTAARDDSVLAAVVIVRGLV
nr:hypothetical protein CFP56_53337 [Quercus suber]